MCAGSDGELPDELSGSMSTSFHVSFPSLFRSTITASQDGLLFVLNSALTGL